MGMPIYKINIVTVHTDLRIYCAGCKKVIRERKNPIAEGNFRWIFACYLSQSEQQLNIRHMAAESIFANMLWKYGMEYGKML